MANQFKAPFPWFGGKSRVASIVWERFGDIKCYAEPFFGSGAVLLGRDWSLGDVREERVNDIDGFVANFWRAVKSDPEQVAHFADNPAFENDLHARHIWLVQRKDSLPAKLEGDPDFFDARIAGWWVWGMSQWIGSGFCSGDGPWGLDDGQLVHLGSNGQGVSRKCVHLGSNGQGVSRKCVRLGDNGQGEAGTGEQGLLPWMLALADRLRHVKVICGSWERLVTPTAIGSNLGTVGVFLDPPYSHKLRNENLYKEDHDVAHDVLEWCKTAPTQYRIALCGYDGEHNALTDLGWSEFAWSASGGYGGLTNRHKERIYFSPACVQPSDGGLF